ncbi:MAG: hypothetical protein JWP01_2533 [Myxococcales bacterium]|nr:hypothetical protein [Myxococcales bacterium]
MSWKQFVRSVEVAQRRAQREAQQRQRQFVRQAAESAREAARRQKQWAKEEKWLQQSGEAAQFEQYMDALVSLHTQWGAHWNWQAVSQTPPPTAPSPAHTAEAGARAALESYQPGFFDRLLGGAKSTRAQLETALAHAIALDAQRNEAAYARYQEDHRLWDANIRLAPNVLRLEPQACAVALKNAGSFDDIERFGTSVRLESVTGDVATLSVLIRDGEIVPEEELKMSATGKLSTKAIPAGRYWSIYQDHVCSCALRIALETFAVLPVRRAIVNIARTMLDESTGHMVRPTILALHVAREDLDRLNLDEIDPSAAMKNFPHRMTFKKTTGLSEVAPITPDEQWASS